MIISGSTKPIFTIFSPNESVLVADLDLFFRHLKGRCHGNQIFWEKRESNEGRLIPRAFFALAFANKLEYHHLYMRINSNDD